MPIFIISFMCFIVVVWPDHPYISFKGYTLGNGNF